MSVTMRSEVIIDEKLARKTAHELIAIGAIQLNVENPFTWVSGIKSPVYCDNRKINSYVTTRNIVVDAFVSLISDHFPGVEMIAGVATGGIPVGILVADRMKLPFIYVRQEPKEHGMMRQIEGDYREGARVVLIEDHVSTGGSSLKAANGLLNGGLEIMALISIMTYNFPQAKTLFQQHGIQHCSLSDLDTVLDTALSEGKLSREQADSVLNFREDPKGWFGGGING